MGATVFLKSKRLKLHKRRHPWVYKNEVDRIEGEVQSGDTVVVRGPKGKFVAHGFVNESSRLFVRLVSFKRKELLDGDLLAERTRRAIGLRQELLRLPERGDAYRLINSEGDGLPGLIVDRYGDVLVLTCSVLGTYQRMNPILDALEQALSPAAIVEAPLSEAIREKEGLPEARGVLRGSLQADEGTVTIDGLILGVRYRGGQKTGLYLDQRDTVQRVSRLAEGRRVLDACCYVGTFGLACAKAGATEILAFDSSQSAIDAATANAERNGVADRMDLRRGSLYRVLRGLADEGRTFDLVVLDPPKFASSRAEVQRARKGYLDANLLALRVLAEDGLLLTCSCSHHMTPDLFEAMLREVGTRAGADLRLIEVRGPGPDHPMDPQCPEGRYLKAYLLQRR